MKKDLYDLLLEKIEAIVKAEAPVEGKLKDICVLLRERVSHYDWVGFYMVNPERERELMLGPFVGDPTDHVNILLVSAL